MAVPQDDELKGLLKQFVCVRTVQMYGVDLYQFAFDGSLTWAIFFMNHDGTVYGRYGSRSALHQNSEREISLSGFKKSMNAALELHRQYQQDRDAIGQHLSGKRPETVPRWRQAEAIPTLSENPRFNRPFVSADGTRAGCIHCHMVPVNELKSLREMGQPIPNRKFFPYPLPDAVGMHLNPQELATVQRVQPDSIAATAGIRPGDRIVRMQGQPIISQADIQWVLHHAADTDTLSVELLRNKDTDEPGNLELNLELPTNWRLQLSDWRFINPRLLQQILGFNVKEMPRQQAKRLGLGGKLALLVDRTTREIRMETGLGHRDLIVAIDGKRDPLTVGALTAYVFREKEKGSKLKVTIMQITDRFPRPEHEVEVTVK